MGKYIETGEPLGKAEWLKKHCNAISLTGRPTEVNRDYVPVCVVHNGQFEAAAITYDPTEAGQFDSKDDKRKREWLLIKVEDAVRLCPKVEGMIDWGR